MSCSLVNLVELTCKTNVELPSESVKDVFISSTSNFIVSIKENLDLTTSIKPLICSSSGTNILIKKFFIVSQKLEKNSGIPAKKFFVLFHKLVKKIPILFPSSENQFPIFSKDGLR